MDVQFKRKFINIAAVAATGAALLLATGEGTATHAANQLSRLGRPASHDCVRLHPDDAADFCQLVEAFGPSNTSIVIVK